MMARAATQRPLRFAFLTTFYPPYNFGGDGIGIERLAHGLVRAGHEVTVIHDADAYETLAPKPPTAGYREAPGLTHIALRSGLTGKLQLLSPLLTQQFGQPIVNGTRIRRLLADGRFDVINYHNVSLIGGPGLLAYGTGIKLYMAHEHWLVCPSHVLWRHGRELCTGRECFRCQLHYKRPPQWWRWTGLLERHLDEVDTFIAMSEFSRAKHREFGFPRDMSVLPYFLPDAPAQAATAAPVELPRMHERPYHLFVGRLEEIKGVQDVLPAFAGPGDTDLVVVGDGEYRAPLEAQAAGNPRVRFTGRVDSDKLAAWYAHAISLLVPSRCFETFGIILLESFRQGTPVIVRKLGPLPELVTQAGGGLIFESEAELRSAMQQLETDAALRARLAAQGRDAVDRYWSERVVIPQYLDLVRQAAVRHDARDVLASLTPDGLA